jgi:transcriptional regulator with XRE-family HTH domain
MIDAAWIGGRIREMREGRGWTREDLAKAAGVSARAIVQWERSEREPSWSNVLALAGAFGVECSAFTTPPAEREPQGRGRPPKAKEEDVEPAPKRPRGRPRKDADHSHRKKGTAKGK